MEHAITPLSQQQLQKCQIIYCEYVPQLPPGFGIMFQAENHNVLGLFVGVLLFLDRAFWVQVAEKQSRSSWAERS